jgi:hypothetical protein
MTSAVQTRHCLFGKASRAPDVPQAIQNQYTGTFAKQEAAWRIKTSLINCIDDKTTTRLTNSFIATRANYSLAMSELGQSRHSDHAPITSGLPRKADIFRTGRHFAFVPKAEIVVVYFCLGVDKLILCKTTI